MSEVERYHHRAPDRRTRPIERAEQTEAYKGHLRIQYGYGLARTAAIEHTALDADIKNLSRDNPGLELTLQGFAEAAAMGAKITIIRYVNRP